jgi:hypothetical protein
MAMYRRGQKTENRGQMAEDRKQITEDRRQIKVGAEANPTI